MSRTCNSFRRTVATLGIDASQASIHSGTSPAGLNGGNRAGTQGAADPTVARGGARTEPSGEGPFHPPQRLAKRARIILLGAAGKGIRESAAPLGLRRKPVRHWRRRWEAAASTARVAERLRDAPHSGAPVTFTVEQIRQITALACEDPEWLPRPLLLNRDQSEFPIRFE